MQCRQWFCWSLSLVLNGSVEHSAWGHKGKYSCEPMEEKSFTFHGAFPRCCYVCVTAWRRGFFRLETHKLMFCLCLRAHGVLTAAVHGWRGRSEHPPARPGPVRASSSATGPVWASSSMTRMQIFFCWMCSYSRVKSTKFERGSKSCKLLWKCGFLWW